jgi:hypothetical protein
METKKIRNYMNANIQDHVEVLTGEVNSTTLAEDAFWALEPDNEGEIPEEYWETAHEVSDAYERETGIK